MDDTTAFAAFKYRYSGSGDISRGRLIAAGIVLVLSFAGMAVLFEVGAFLLVAALFLFFVRDKRILLGPRYLLCGETLIYYANVRRLQYSELSGELAIVSGDGRTFKVERQCFPTGARKKDKIARNKAAKFTKVTGKIIEKVRRAAPHAEMQGIPRSL